MAIELTHPFLRRCLDSEELLDGVEKFSTFDSRLKKQAKKYAKGDVDLENEYKGWAFEIFVEMLVKSSGPSDKRIGVIDYQLVEEDEDTGVDGFGTGTNGKAATVQAKYRQANYVLTANGDHLTNFMAASQNKYGVDIDDTKNMLIITCGKGLHYHTEEQMLRRKVRCLSREQIRVMVDKNIAFWNAFREAWESALVQS